MRICLVTSASLPPEEGLGYHIWNLAKQLTRRGHQVTIITRGGAGRTQREVLEGIPVYRVTFFPLYPFHVHVHGAFARRLMPRIQEEQAFDLLHAHTPLPAVMDGDLPMLTTVHSPMRSDTAATGGKSLFSLLLRLQSPFSQIIELDLFGRSRKVTAVAEWVAEALRPYGVEPREVAITGNGVEPCFVAVPDGRERKPWIVYTGRLEPGKGLEDLIEAAALVVAAGQDPALRFVIVGKGSLAEKLQAMVREKDLVPHFHFMGFVGPAQRSKLVRLYQEATLFVLPSHHEGMPTALLEAMGTGLPVVSTAVGGAAEVIRSGENGVLVAPHRPAQLADAILSLIRQPALRRRLGERGHETVNACFSWDAIAERYLSCYAAVMEAADRA